MCSLAFLVLINFNNLTIILALGSMPLAFTYPLMKRFTYWPQLFLGVTFNYGLILGWTAIVGEINIVAYYLLSRSHILDTRFRHNIWISRYQR